MGKIVKITGKMDAQCQNLVKNLHKNYIFIDFFCKKHSLLR